MSLSHIIIPSSRLYILHIRFMHFAGLVWNALSGTALMIVKFVT